MLAEAAEGRRPQVAQAYVPTQATQATQEQAGDAGAASGQHASPVTDAGHGVSAATVTPVTPLATVHRGDAPAPVAKRRRRVRTIALVVLLAVLVGAGGAAAMYYANEWRQGAGSATAADQGEQSTDSVPEGWVRVEDPEGFSLALPEGWKRQVDGEQIDYTPDNGEHFLRVAVDDSPDFDSPYRHQLDLEEQVKVRSEYRRVRLEENIYRDRPGALWDFTWTAVAKDTEFPGPRRAIEQMYLARDGVEYTIYMSAPAADWETAEEQFYAVLRSWRPTGR